MAPPKPGKQAISETASVEVTAKYKGLMKAEGPDGEFDVSGFVEFDVTTVNKNNSKRTVSALVELLSVPADEAPPSPALAAAEAAAQGDDSGAGIGESGGDGAGAAVASAAGDGEETSVVVGSAQVYAEIDSGDEKVLEIVVEDNGNDWVDFRVVIVKVFEF